MRPFTRRDFDWTERYPRINAAVAALPATSATIDGEAVCCDEAGIAVFEKLHSRSFNVFPSLKGGDFFNKRTTLRPGKSQ